MKSKNKIRWGIIGLGHIANKFATDLLTIKDAELYAVASRKKASANEFATKYGAKNAYGSYEELANDPNIDAVYIATPHTFHKENTLMCLEKGIAVLCEKPFAMNINEVEEMIAKSLEKDVLLMEAMWTYFLPHYQYVLELLKRKELGDIIKIEADFGGKPTYDVTHRLFNKELGGGSLLDIGIYPIFVALSTLGLPEEIKAKAKYFPTGADSVCDMEFIYANGVKAFLKSTMIEETPTTATFFCERGEITINSKFFMPSTVTIKNMNGEEKTIDDFNYTTLGFSYEINHFNTLLRKGKKQSPVMSFDFSRKLISLLDKTREKIGLEYHFE